MLRDSCVCGEGTTSVYVCVCACVCVRVCMCVCVPVYVCVGRGIPHTTHNMDELLARTAHMDEVWRISDTHMNDSELWHLPPTPKEMERAASISITNESCYAHTYKRVMVQIHN